MDKNLINIGFLAESYDSILGVVQDTDSEKPTDRSKVNKFEETLFDARGWLRWVSNDSKVVSCSSNDGKTVAFNLIECGFIGFGNCET